MEMSLWGSTRTSSAGLTAPSHAPSWHGLGLPNSGLCLGEGMASCLRVLAGTTANSPRGGLQVFSLVNGEKGNRGLRWP